MYKIKSNRSDDRSSYSSFTFLVTSIFVSGMTSSFILTHSSLFRYEEDENQWTSLLKTQEEFYQTKLINLQSVLTTTHNALKNVRNSCLSSSFIIMFSFLLGDRCIKSIISLEQSIDLIHRCFCFLFATLGSMSFQVFFITVDSTFYFILSKIHIAYQT